MTNGGTGALAEAPSQGLKRAVIWNLDAALKRRSSTSPPGISHTVNCFASYISKLVGPGVAQGRVMTSFGAEGRTKLTLRSALACRVWFRLRVERSIFLFQYPSV